MAAVDAPGTASLRATAGAHTTASITHAATGTARSASRVHPSWGSTTSWNNSFPGRIASSPAPSLRRADPASVRLNASPPTPCARRRQRPAHASRTRNTASGPTDPACLVSCTPGAGHASFLPTSTPSSPAAALPRTPRRGSPHAPTALSQSKRCRPSPALSAQRRDTLLPSGQLATRRAGTGPGTATARPIHTATPPAPLSPLLSSQWPSPPAASCASRTARSPSPPVKLAAHAHAPPRATPWSVSAGSSRLLCPMASCTSATAAFCTHAVPSLRTPSGR